MPTPTSQGTSTVSFDVDNVPYSFDWSGAKPPTNTDYNGFMDTVRGSASHKNAALFYNQPTIPSGIAPADVAAYRAKWFDDEGQSEAAPAKLLSTLSRLPLSARNSAIPSEWSPIGRAALLQSAYQANPALPVTAQYLVNKGLGEAGITAAQAKSQGISPAIKNNQVTRNNLLEERDNLVVGQISPITAGGAMMPQPYIPETSIYNTDPAKAKANKARLAQVDAQLASMGMSQSAPPTQLPFEGPNIHAGSLNRGIAGLMTNTPYAQAPASPVGVIVYKAMGQPGTWSTMQQTPGILPHLATGIGSFAEPESLALLAAMGPALAPLGAMGHIASTAAFGLPVAKNAIEQFQQGNYGSGIGDAAAFLLPFGLGKVHSVIEMRTLKGIASGDITMSPKLAKKYEGTYNLDAGTLSDPATAQQFAQQITAPKTKGGAGIDTSAPDTAPVIDPAVDALIQSQTQTAPPVDPTAAPDLTQPGVPVPAAAPPVQAQPVQAQPVQTPTPDTSGPLTGTDLPPMQQQVMSPYDVGVNPDLQYKTKDVTDRKNMVTDALKGTDVYDVNQGGTWTVYKDEKGDTYAVNSHHRRELAQRAERFVSMDSNGELQDVAARVPVRVLDAKDGWTIEKAQGYGALENIRDGKGTALDALDVMRKLKITPERFSKVGISLTSELARNIDALSNLNPEAITRVRLEDVTESAGAGIGSVKDLSPAAQNAALDEAVDKGFDTFSKASKLAKEYAYDERMGLMAKDTADNQTTMFGDDLTGKISSTRAIRVEIKDQAARKIQREYQGLLHPTEDVLKPGEVIDVQGRQDEAATMAESLKALKARTQIVLDNPEVSTEVARLAAEVGNGKLKQNDAAKQVADIIRLHVGKSLNDLISPAGL